jgi:hypothetical protein
MVYLPKTEAGKKLNEVMGAFNTAEFQWNTYATQLGRGYTTAYNLHQEAIGKINENLKLKAEEAYWLLSLLCVAFAGGVAGGLMAPWVSKAGQVTSQLIIRNKMSAAAANAVSGVVQKGTDVAKPSTAPLVPAVKDPLSYVLDMLGEIGLCFSDLRSETETQMKLADDAVISVDDANEMVRVLMLDPLLKDSPSSKDMPDATLVAREAELGMWIAWAGTRDLRYWNRAIASISRGVSSTDDDYFQDAKQFEPIVDRLRILGPDALTAGSMGVRVHAKAQFAPGNWWPRVVNIPALTQSGYKVNILSGADVFLRKVSEVVKFPQKVLPELDQKRPVYREN